MFLAMNQRINCMVFKIYTSKRSPAIHMCYKMTTPTNDTYPFQPWSFIIYDMFSCLFVLLYEQYKLNVVFICPLDSIMATLPVFSEKIWKSAVLTDIK